MGWLSGPCEPDDHEVMVVLDSEPVVDDDDEGNSLLHALAADPDGHLVELAPGVYYESKLHQRGEHPSDRG